MYVLTLVHSLYILALLRFPPPNVFSALELPINAAIPHLERLASSELRALYVRFGHNVFLSCEHCQTFEDYALYAFPRPALAYLREIAFVGLLTLEKLNRSHLRPLGVGILVAAFVTETYLLATAPISIPSASTSIRVEDTYMVRARAYNRAPNADFNPSGTISSCSTAASCSSSSLSALSSCPLYSSTLPARCPSHPCSSAVRYLSPLSA